MTKTGPLVLRAHVSVLHFPVVRTLLHVCTMLTLSVIQISQFFPMHLAHGIAGNL